MNNTIINQQSTFSNRIPVLLLTVFLLSCVSEPRGFKKHVISNVFISEGVTTGDVNGDGKTDIMAGTFWFEAPGWQRHRIHADTLNPVPGYSTTFLNFSMDVNQDGRIDLIRFDQPGESCTWYENPGDTSSLWKGRVILRNAGNESPAFVDVDNDGRPDIICNDPVAKKVIWLKSPSKGDTTWRRTIIGNDSTRATHRYTHGMGWGDINKDGRPDLVVMQGWWEAPKDVFQEGWTFHEVELGKECANMFVHDVDDDGDMDVISSSAHDYGIWWYEQEKGKGGKPVFTSHLISKSFSQSHALAFADMNGDGNPDLVTGKRYFAHNGKDPGAFEPSVLCWFEFRRGRDPQWIQHQVDDNSGIGNSFVVDDINNDKLPDIIVSNKKGAYFFEQVGNSK